MAERPDLEYVVPVLQERLQDQRVVSVTVHKPIVLRVAVAGDAPTLLREQVFAKVERRAHFVIFGFAQPALQMVVSPMLAGRFLLGDKKLPRDTAMTWRLANDEVLVYRDDVQMGRIADRTHEGPIRAGLVCGEVAEFRGSSSEVPAKFARSSGRPSGLRCPAERAACETACTPSCDR